MTADNTQKSDIEQSVDQYMAYLHGDASNVSVTAVVLDTPPQYTAAEVKRIRRKVGVTQWHFASLLAVSPRTVEAWEVGRTEPLGSAAGFYSCWITIPNYCSGCWGCHRKPNQHAKWAASRRRLPIYYRLLKVYK